MNFANEQEDAARRADLIIERPGETFLCYRQANSNRWRICLYRVTENGTTRTTQMLWPNGSMAYDFTPEDIDNYNFEYKK